MPQPEVPAPAHADVDSMLSRRFGKEVHGAFNYVGFDLTNKYRLPTTFQVCSIQSCVIDDADAV